MSDHDPRYWPVLRKLVTQAGPGPLLDVGANAGEFSAMLLAAFPQRRIVAFEPDPLMSDALRERFAGHSNLQVQNVALWRSCGEAEFHRHEDTATSSLLPRNVAGRRYYSATDRTMGTAIVATETLDAFSARSRQPRFPLVKLDTQGAELAILEGAVGLLRAGAIELIYTEFFVVPHYEGAPLLPDLWNLLRRFGYDLYDLFRGAQASNGQLRFGDALFVSPSFRRVHLDSQAQEP